MDSGNSYFKETLQREIMPSEKKVGCITSSKGK